MRRVPVLSAIILLMSVSACGPADAEPAAVTPATSPASRAASVAPASVAPASSITAQGLTACKLAAAAPRTGEAIEIDEQAVKAIIANAGKSGVAGIERAGTQVQSRYSAWLGAGIGDGAAKAQDDLLDAVGRVRSACVAAGATT